MWFHQPKMSIIPGRAGTRPHKKREPAMVLFFFVRAKGIEPIRLTAPDPKSGLSTNFNTPATVFLPIPEERIANVQQFI